MRTSRRSFLKSVGMTGSLGLTESRPLLSGFLESRKPTRIWDVHSHLHHVPGDTPEARMARLIQFADRVGIERLILSQGYSADLHPTEQQLREENNRVLRALRAFPDRAYGSVYLSPAYLRS